jgi:hypothetical protein
VISGRKKKNEVEVISEGRRESSRSDQAKQEENQVEVISGRKKKNQEEVIKRRMRINQVELIKRRKKRIKSK